MQVSLIELINSPCIPLLCYTSLSSVADLTGIYAYEYDIPRSLGLLLYHMEKQPIKLAVVAVYFS